MFVPLNAIMTNRLNLFFPDKKLGLSPLKYLIMEDEGQTPK